MIRRIVIGSPLALATALPFDVDSHDKISKSIKTARDFESRKPSNETGLDRIKRMFIIDDFGQLSAELNSILQSGFLGMFVGACYGGFMRSKNEYQGFMDANQATAFRSTFDAKKALQDRVTTGFAKGAFRWGWRVSLFTTSYVGIITIMSVYRGKSTILEYLTAGAVTGGMFRMNLGLRGLTAGAIIGSFIGGVAGGASLGIMKMTGYSMDEIRYWQYQWHEKRIETELEVYREGTKQEPNPLLDAHHERLGGEDKLSLDAIPDEASKESTSATKENTPTVTKESTPPIKETTTKK